MNLLMKLLGIGISLLFWAGVPMFSQNNVRISGTLTDCPVDTLLFFELDGVGLRPTAKIPLTSNASSKVFQIEVGNLQEGFYFLGQGAQANTRMVLLSTEPAIHIQGSCPTLAKATILQSPLNKAVDEATRQANQYANQFQQQIRLYQQARRNRGNMAAIEKQMGQIDAQKLSLYDSLKIHHPYVGKLIGLRTYLSYQNHGQGYKNESIYFAKNYFRFTELGDPAYNSMPQFHEAIKTYSSTLVRVNLDGKEQLSYFQEILDKVPAGSRAHKAAILGGVAGFQGKNDYAFVGLAEMYIDQYPQDNPRIAKQLSGQITRAKAKMIGAIAPEISLPTPEGDTVRLSDLRGKVVLVDFWASWCGPCRRENPNVVALYNKYKDRGFEILGVSLDKNKASWLKAIDKDGLTWPHISDLKHWKSAAAQTYGVSSIPFTLLLDKEGRIVAKKLRGPQLEAKVAQLLKGESGTGK
ncbi:MAG: redoxin domain-containing protein [Bacteroidota bacterium]